MNSCINPLILIIVIHIFRILLYAININYLIHFPVLYKY